MRFFSSIFVAALALTGFWVLLNLNPQLQEIVQSYVENGEFITLEARFSPEQIMSENKTTLLTDKKHTYLEPSLKFYPYLLLEVKYTQADGRTKEGVILWSMTDGEMVIDTESWEKTHGFQDAIAARATRQDFLIINTLNRFKGALPIQRLQKELNVDNKTMESWIEDARKKYLVVKKGGEIALHFQQPHFSVTPQTRINQWLVTKPYSHAERVSKKYSRFEIEKAAKACFGHDFTVRTSKEVFLPVYSIGVQNPDGSVFTSYWNALNGRRVDNRYLSLSP